MYAVPCVSLKFVRAQYSRTVRFMELGIRLFRGCDRRSCIPTKDLTS